MRSVAILGANGQIGRGLALALARDESLRLRLFARQPAQFQSQAAAGGLLRPGIDEVRSLDGFEDDRYDLIVNAAGPGSRKRQIALGRELLSLTEALDLRVLEQLRHRPETAYVHLSTGAVYGFDCPWPVAPDAVRAFAETADGADAYPRAKRAAEARHRELGHLRIYDIRIFGYFSRFIPLDDGFFLSEVANAVVNGAALRTSRTDMVRDYIDHAELAALIEVLMRANAPNAAIDVYSRAPVGKHELLQRVAEEFGLRVDYEGGDAGPLVRQPKPAAPSQCRRAVELGHRARRSSVEIVVGELRALLDMHYHRAG